MEKELTFTMMMTERETAMVAQRLVIARKVLDGATYDQINEEFGAGSSTVALVRRLLREQGFISG